MESKGATIIDPVELPDCEVTEWDWHVLRYEFKKDLNEYLAGLHESVLVRSLADVIAFNAKNADKALKYGQDTLIGSEETNGTLTEQEYLESIKKNREIARRGLDQVLEKHRLDALLFLGIEGGSDLAVTSRITHAQTPKST